MIAEFVDGEGFADDVDWTKLVEDLAQPRGIEVVDFEVPVLRLRTHQGIAHTTTDEQRTAASFANGFGK